MKIWKLPTHSSAVDETKKKTPPYCLCSSAITGGREVQMEVYHIYI